jgi:hypothetical protein
MNKMPPGEATGSGTSSEGGQNNESQDTSGGNSPARENGSSPQQPPQPSNGKSQPQLAPQLSSNGHARSTSQPILHVQPVAQDDKSLIAPIPTTTPPFFEQSSPHVLPPNLPSALSPLATPNNGFVSHTPMSGYEDFVGTIRDNSDGASPQFLMDPWTNMSMGQEFDPMRIDPSLMMTMNMDINMGGSADGILGILPEMSPSHAFGPVQTPRVDEAYSDLQIGSSASIYYPSNRRISIADVGIPDLGAIIAAQDGWTVFRCTPPIPSSSCPRTAKLNLERLEISLKNHEGWSTWRPVINESDYHQEGRVDVAKIHEATRDKLLAITQSFLHKALDIHKDGSSSSTSSGGSPESTASNFIILPPAQVLDLFLRSYANSFERFYPTTACGLLDANELMQNYNDKASSLLILMMIAQGAMTIPSIEARWLTGGFTEACRISLFDLVEKNIIMAGDPIVLRAALLFIVQAAWSGDKWQMDIAMGQRGMYFAMLRNSGILEPQKISTPHMNGNPTADALWRDWIHLESRSR